MENGSLFYSGDPLVRVFLCIQFVTLIIISGHMGVFSLFSFRLVECSYKGEVALISSTVYSITSDTIQFIYTTVTSVGY